MLRSAALLAVLLLAACCCADANRMPVGRFASQPPYRLPCFAVSGEGFRLGQLQFVFDSDEKGYFAGTPSWTEKVLLVASNPAGAHKLRLYVDMPCFDALFGKVMRIRVDTSGRAFLTWPEGSVGEGIPASPDARWLALSFSSKLPVLGLCFGERPDEVRVLREGGALWLTARRDEGIGWVRFAAPLGDAAFPTGNAASLGALAKSMGPTMASIVRRAGAPSALPAISLEANGRIVSVRERSTAVPPAVARAREAGLPDLSLAGPARAIPTREGPLLLTQARPAYSLQVPLEGFVLAADRGKPVTVPAGDSLDDLLHTYAARFYLAESDRLNLTMRLGAAADRLTAPDAWEWKQQPRTGLSLWRLRSAQPSDAVADHARAGILLAAATESGVPVPSGACASAIRRCVRFVEAFMDWSLLVPCSDGAPVDADGLALAFALAQDAKRLEWHDADFEAELAWLAARLGLAIHLRLIDGARSAAPPADVLPTGPMAGEYYMQGLGGHLAKAVVALKPVSAAAAAIADGQPTTLGLAVWLNGAHAPILLDLPQWGRLLGAEYDSRSPGTFAVRLTPGGAFDLAGFVTQRIVAALLDGANVTVRLGAAGRWRVTLPALTKPAVVEFRLAPTASGGTNPGRRAPGSPR